MVKTGRERADNEAESGSESRRYGGRRADSSAGWGGVRCPWGVCGAGSSPSGAVVIQARFQPKKTLSEAALEQCSCFINAAIKDEEL